MERRQGRIGAAAFGEPAAVLVGLAVEDGTRVLAVLRFPLLGLGGVEEGRRRQVSEEANLAELEPGLVPPVAQVPIGDVRVRRADPPAETGVRVQRVAHPETAQQRRLRGVPVKRLELPPREPDQRIAVPQRVVDERQGVFLRQRGQPERHFGQIDRHRVAVDAVEATLDDEPAGGDDLVLAGRQLGRGLVDAPRLDQRIAELTAGFDQEGPRAHRRIADLQVEDRLRQRRLAAGAAQAGENRLQRGAHDRLGQFARRVVRPGPAARLARLQHHRARRHEVGRGGGVNHRLQRCVQVGDGLQPAATGLRTVSVSVRSVRSRSHCARRPPGSPASASRSTAVGAPCFFWALIATDRPVAVSSRNPIIVS